MERMTKPSIASPWRTCDDQGLIFGAMLAALEAGRVPDE
jgi:hypothetical protein